MSKTLLVAFIHDRDEAEDFPGGLLTALRKRKPSDVEVRLATAADIPADLAAEALGVSAEHLTEGAKGVFDLGWTGMASIFKGAARRVRELEEAKAGGER